MSCPRTRETDFAAFVLDRRAPEWSALREHYPRCSDCGHEVLRWSRLGALLREEGGAVSEHPSPQRLLAFQSAPGSLAPDERTELESHLAACAPCRSELRVLAGFDFSALAPAREASGEPAREGWLDRLAERLFGVSLAPAFAAALVLLVAVPAAFFAWRTFTGEAPDAADRPLVAVIPEAEPSPEVIAQAGPEAPSEEPLDVAPSAPRAETAPPPSETPPSPSPPRPAPARPALPRPPEPLGPRPLRPQQIAALLPSELPSYRPDAGLAGGTLEPVRVASLVRAGTQPLPALRVLAPEHVGAVAEPAPTLYWHLSAASDVPVEIAVYSARDEATPLFEQTLEPPVAAGLHVFRLAEHGLRLEPGVRTTWSAALVPDRARRDLDAVSSATLRYAPPGEAERARIDAAPPAERAHALAASGYWLDAFATFTAWVEAEPDAKALRTQRAVLLEQVGLGEVAGQL